MCACVYYSYIFYAYRSFPIVSTVSFMTNDRHLSNERHRTQKTEKFDKMCMMTQRSHFMRQREIEKKRKRIQ